MLIIADALKPLSMKKQAIFYLILLVLLGFQAASQSFRHIDAKDLSITWRLVTNNYKGQSLNQSTIQLENHSKKMFPGTGWTIYFNYTREIYAESLTGDVLINHLNGDIYQLKPGQEFKNIKPGKAAVITYVSDDELLNLTSAPSGFYIVWDDNLTEGESLCCKLEPIRDSTIRFVTPESRYSKNESIRDIPESRLVKVFPTPVTYRETGEYFQLDKEVQIIADPAFTKEASYLAEQLYSDQGIKPDINAGIKTTKSIVLKKSSMPDDAYTLNVTTTEITITASSNTGIFYGIQSLRTMLPSDAIANKISPVIVPAVSVSDAPRFGYRGLLLDIARNFQTKHELMKVLDLMALYKLNVLHLHFSDDEGWRIEIPALPELTQVGSRRGHTLDSKEFLPASYCAGPVPGKLQGSGFYTKSDFIEILKYANDRHIMVVPEIESPGHSRAAIKAMDARYKKFKNQNNRAEAEKYLLRDTLDKSTYSSAQLWTDNVMCVALPSTYRFLEKVIDELILMYAEADAPLTTIHLGGDEVPQGVWEKSPACQELIKADPGLNSTDDLWYFYFENVSRILKTRNLALSGWEEIAMRKTLLDSVKHYIPNPDFVNEDFRVNVWNNGIGWGSEDLPYRLANAGYKVVLSCVSNLYFDLAYEKSPEEPGYYWGGFQDIDKPYYFIPFDYYKNTTEDTGGNPVSESLFIGKDRLTDYGKSNILGIQGQLWSENVRDTLMLEYLLLPKLLSLAERAWAKNPDWAAAKSNEAGRKLYNEAYSGYVNVLGKRELPRLDYLDGGFNYRIPTPGAIIKDGKVMVNFQIPGMILRFTTDGSEPGLKSRVYTEPITEKGEIKVCAFSSSNHKGKSLSIRND
jgi:hexosaminidase